MDGILCQSVRYMYTSVAGSMYVLRRSSSSNHGQAAAETYIVQEYVERLGLFIANCVRCRASLMCISVPEYTVQGGFSLSHLSRCAGPAEV
ncbi:unnamed protein product [Trichogramma brassicae]|uniref:Uncharacterized protein n=1 Tax=Trichogramma brassicae TaxID=86971 RepID=A0A6H5I093_9HYME|nr:unnamed protein product [Trichogramma brassicae]